jgi:hypothetical protein
MNAHMGHSLRGADLACSSGHSLNLVGTNMTETFAVAIDSLVRVSINALIQQLACYTARYVKQMA